MTLRSGLFLLALLLVLATAAYSAGPFTTLKAQYPVGASPRGVVVYDNGLSHNIAVANGGDNTVTVLMGACSPNCNYLTKGPFAVGAGPTSIDKGHFWKSTAWDLVTANNLDDTVTILKNDGFDNFTTFATIGAGDYPQSVVVGDFNGDGRDDIAVTNASSANQTVTLLLNKCTASPCNSPDFTVKTLPVLPNAVLPWGLAKGTFVGNPLDGQRDLVVANYYSRYYGLYGSDVLLNTRTKPAWNGFQAPVAYPGGFYAPAVTTGHFAYKVSSIPQDDFAVTNYGGKVLVFLNDGNGKFSSPVPNSAGTTTFAIVNVGNVGGNSLDDLVVTNYCENKITVLLSAGGGVYNPSAESPIAVGQDPVALAAGVLGTAGKMLVVANKDDNNIMILK